MADAVLQAVAVRRDLISGVGTRDTLHTLIADYVTRQAFTDPAKLNDMTRDIFRQMQRKFFPEADRIGAEAAKPILDRLGGAKLVDRGSVLRGRVLDSFRTYRKNNLNALLAELRLEKNGLSGEIEAAFMRARRDGVSRKQLIDDLVASDKAEMARLAEVHKELDAAAKAQRVAERNLARASKRGTKRAKSALKEARKAHTKARAKLKTSKGFFSRFETKVQGHARDAVRRESERASYESFRQAGVTRFTWVAVNGSDACPSCSERHGMLITPENYSSESPGNADTYCGQSCMCSLVPESYTKNNPSLVKPIKAVDAPDLTKRANAPGKTLEPIRLGGKSQDIAKRARKRGPKK